ncbi:tRNA lysidine(34) synthetase TilS [Mesoplasma chauliocola]|uniref:tRNA(Ile)-lysidine synthase n=1 Tax=Mesoplasma chauliocola TaxID=216427 RepID=A0A249SP44_9MOLU|nr:tRNA lysidine(34) synthetase TilS [Mesoplasma chauliocola]ASZ09445.1 tRNA lysidine(34) synthetase TilS [Mesoplasma chauliocola]
MNKFKLNKDTSYLVAVSGGPDSMFMLNSLIEQELTNFVVCHVNYNFRKDSNNDFKIVKKFCEKYNLKLEFLNVDQDYSELKENFESWARKTRYDFFVKIGNKYGIKNILVAHNRNDFVETYLLQKERKNYAKYYGLNKVSKYKEMNIIRPMLNILKSEILHYLQQQEIEFAIDSTNTDIKYKRNEIRASLKEEDFASIENEIKIKNQELNKLNLEVDWYVNNNMSAEELVITKNFKDENLEFIQRCVYKWLEIIKKDHLVQNRSNKTVFEIAKNIKTSHKVFWSMNIENYCLVKDYENIFIIKADLTYPKSFEIKTKEDLYKIEEFINWLDIFNAIKKNKEKYPYVVTNDYTKYKFETYTLGKKTNRYFIDKKIRYKNRMLKAVVYSKRTKKILNNIK